jgi:hypothetical protein
MIVLTIIIVVIIIIISISIVVIIISLFYKAAIFAYFVYLNNPKILRIPTSPVFITPPATPTCVLVTALYFYFLRTSDYPTRAPVTYLPPPPPPCR